MEQEKIDRINALSRLARERELTPEEHAERQILRNEYLAEWRLGAEQVLQNTKVQLPDGTLVPLKKKKKD
jgi:uncharacterized protein YnzC (UPF0291/DUF896 family)